MCLADARHISLPLITLWFLLLLLGWCILPGPPTVVFGFSFSLCLRDTACLIQNCHRRSVSSPKHVGTCYPQISSDQVTFCATDEYQRNTFGRSAFDFGLAASHLFCIWQNMFWKIWRRRHLFSLLFFSRLCFRGRPTLVAMYHQKTSTGILNIWVEFNFFPCLAAAFLDQFLVQLQLCQPANKSHKLVQIEELNLVSPGRKEMN